MKKTLLFALLIASSALLFAAETKKVAILEIEDTENVLDHGQKLMLRSSLAKAVANTPGYEAFDRTSLDAIMEEHNFQRSGFVNQKEIKALGEITGASFILISEAAKTPDRMLVLAVKLVDVETAKVEMSDNAVMGLSSEEMQRGCDALASTLLDKKRHGKRIAAEDPSARHKELLTRVGLLNYVYDGTKMNGKEYEKFLLRNCTPAYKQYHSGKLMQYFGYGSFGLGVVLIGVGAPMLSSSKSKVHSAGAALVSVGTISAAAGVTLWSFGFINKRKSINTFNTSCTSQYHPLELRLNAGVNTLGLAFVF